MRFNINDKVAIRQQDYKFMYYIRDWESVQVIDENSTYRYNSTLYKLSYKVGRILEQNLTFADDNLKILPSIGMYIWMFDHGYGRIYKNESDQLGVEYKNIRKIYNRFTGKIKLKYNDIYPFPDELTDFNIVNPHDVSLDLKLGCGTIKSLNDMEILISFIQGGESIVNIMDLDKNCRKLVMILINDMNKHDEEGW